MCDAVAAAYGGEFFLMPFTSVSFVGAAVVVVVVVDVGCCM